MDGVMTLPQASEIDGGAGATAYPGQLIVEAPFAGSIKSGAAIV
jgi:hypothetical protein